LGCPAHDPNSAATRGDISNWLDAGHTREELDALFEQLGVRLEHQSGEHFSNSWFTVGDNFSTTRTFRGPIKRIRAQ